MSGSSTSTRFLRTATLYLLLQALPDSSSSIHFTTASTALVMLGHSIPPSFFAQKITGVLTYPHNNANASMQSKQKNAAMGPCQMRER